MKYKKIEVVPISLTAPSKERGRTTIMSRQDDEQPEYMNVTKSHWNRFGKGKI